MKNLKHIALFLSCLVIASCTKDIDEKEPSNECSILDIQLTGQLGKATIERVDDNQGTVTLYIFEQADYPWEAVGVEALAVPLAEILTFLVDRKSTRLNSSHRT